MSEVVGWICIRGRGGGCTPITRDDLSASQQTELPFPELPAGGHNAPAPGRRPTTGKASTSDQRALF